MLKIYLRVIGLLKPEKKLAITLLIANLGLSAAQFLDPVLFGKIIDKLVSAQNLAVTDASGYEWAQILPLLIAWTGFGLFTIVASILISLYADRLSHRRRQAVLADYFDHVISLPMGFHSKHHTSVLIRHMSEGSGGMFWLWLSFYREHCAALMSVFVMLPLSLLINWRLGLLLVVLVVVFATLTNFVLRRSMHLQSVADSHHTALTERAQDALGNAAIVQSFTRIHDESQALRQLGARALKAQWPVLNWWAVATIATRASATLTVLGIFIIGLLLHVNGQISIGAIVTFSSFATQIIARLEQVVNFTNQLLHQLPKISSYFEMLDTVPAIADRLDARDIGRAKGQVRFEAVSFAYEDRAPAVSDVSFTVNPGEVVALVGATGSGKSTTLSLLHRAFDPRQGRIMLDDYDIRDLKLTCLRRNIGIVFQEPMLFARSIAENLRVGKPDASIEEMWHALDIAQARTLVEELPEKLDAVVGERGRSLSGGERQKIAIARAIIKDPPLLVLDEATSALDSRTEQALSAALTSAMVGRTTFIIAHRLSTITRADKVLVFERGRIIEQGRFAELSAQDGALSALLKAQYGGLHFPPSPAKTF